MKHTHPSSFRLAARVIIAAGIFVCTSVALAQATPSTAKPAVTTASATVPSAPANTGPLPSAQEIFAKAVAAGGGADLIRMQTARTQIGTVEMAAQSLKGTIITKSVEPNMLLIETDIPSFGKIRQGVNGTVGWGIDPMRGASLMTADEVARITRESSIEAELNAGLGCDPVEVVEQCAFAGGPCFKVKMKCGESVSTRFYSVESGHLVGSVSVVKSSMGEFEVTTTYKDFVAFSGRTLAKVQENAMMGQTQTLTLTAIDFSPIDAAAFALPPEIQALVNAAKNPALAVPPTPAVPVAPALPATK